jgi:hypothetical protein
MRSENFEFMAKHRQVKRKEDEGRKTKGWEERSSMETPGSRLKILKVLWRKEKEATGRRPGNITASKQVTKAKVS